MKSTRSDFRKMVALARDSRSLEQMRVHYECEKTLARQLREAPASQRATTYQRVYSELFATLSHHPQKVGYFGDTDYVDRQFNLLKRLVSADSIFVEVGAGDARLSIRMAERCKMVYAVDVTDGLFDATSAPTNFQFLMTDGIRLSIEANGVDFVYSNQLMEHLHPDDARAQLAEIHRILKPGGRYFCITPNAVTGPHDVSKYFDDVATGFHLKEYNSTELSAAMRTVGFRRVSTFFVCRGHYLFSPTLIFSAIEKITQYLNLLTKNYLKSNKHVRIILGLNMIAWK